jgi:hypothetical protein
MAMMGGMGFVRDGNPVPAWGNRKPRCLIARKIGNEAEDVDPCNKQCEAEAGGSRSSR